ncbi:MAG: leucine-rich repeat protein [Paramuribaculum sp.]|nr:leucine-rich repeat protein [Paramuribaculum sp.]
MKQKLLLYVIAIVFQSQIFARDFQYSYKGQTITYTVLDEEAKTCKTKAGTSFSAGNQNPGSVILPSNPKDGEVEYTLLSIGDFSFSRIEGLTSMELPNTVIEIGKSAFQGSTDLQNVQLSDNLTSIGTLAFGACSSLNNIEFPGSLKSIGKRAFGGCSSLNRLELPENLIELSDGAFNQCSQLKEITIPLGIKTLDSSIFEGCTSLESVKMPEVEVIKYGAFQGCSSLSEIEFPNTLSSIEAAAFYGCSSLVSVSFPESIKNIGNSSFSGCRALTDLAFPNNELLSESITIGNGAFSGCTNLSYLILPKSISSIGTRVFEGCTSLSEVVIKDSNMPLILDYSSMNGIEFLFSECPLTNVYIGRSFNRESLDSTGEAYIPLSPFYYCRSIKKVSFGPLVTEIQEFLFDQSLALETINMTSSIKVIGRYAFRDCMSIVKVNLPENLENIMEGAFTGNSKLESISIPETTIQLGKIAFAGCETLNSVSITKVQYIEESAFINCTNIESVKIENLTDWASINFENKYSNPLCYGGKLILNSNEINELTIPNDINAINDYAFSGVSTLKKVNISDNIENIGVGAFEGCKDLETISIPGTVKSIGDNAFEGCLSLREAIIGNLESQTVENILYRDSQNHINGESVIGVSAFADCERLKRIVIGANISTIKNKAFGNCKNVSQVLSYSITPPIVESTSFDSDIEKFAELHVPVGYIDVYKESDVWNKFTTIIDDIGKIAPENISLNNSDVTLNVEESVKLIATVTPENATDKSITWSSSDEKIAAVDASGKVTAIEAGTAVITATSSNGLTASCTVTVKAKPSSIDGIEADEDSAVRVEGGNIIAPEGSEVYDLNGRRVTANGLRPGIYIVRIPGGKSVKILMK